MMLTDEAITLAVGARLAAQMRAGDVVTLAGSLGVGKTTLARGVLCALGYTGDVPSPSYPLVIPYAQPDVRIPIWHVDLYRLDDSREVAELTLEDAVLDGALLIEWPERLGCEWPGALALTLEIAANDARRLTADVPPAWKDRWPFP